MPHAVTQSVDFRKISANLLLSLNLNEKGVYKGKEPIEGFLRTPGLTKSQISALSELGVEVRGTHGDTIHTITINPGARIAQVTAKNYILSLEGANTLRLLSAKKEKISFKEAEAAAKSLQKVLKSRGIPHQGIGVAFRGENGCEIALRLLFPGGSTTQQVPTKQQVAEVKAMKEHKGVPIQLAFVGEAHFQSDKARPRARSLHAAADRINEALKGEPGFMTTSIGKRDDTQSFNYT